MPAKSDKVYANRKNPFFSTAGLTVVDKTETFKASVTGGDKIELVATYPQVNFNGDLAVVTAAFGTVEAAIKDLQESVNAWLQVQGKNAVKGSGLEFEKKVVSGTEEAISQFMKDRNLNSVTDEQRKKISAKVRARLVELEKIAKESIALDDIE